MADFVPNSGVQPSLIQPQQGASVGEFSFVDTADDDYFALMRWSETVLASGEEETIDERWKPKIGEVSILARLWMTYGGKKFVEFEKPLRSIFLVFPPVDEGQTRHARSYTSRYVKGTDLETYLEKGFDFPPPTEPAKTSAWGFGPSFTPSIVAMEIEGPCCFEDIFYGANPVVPKIFTQWMRPIEPEPSPTPRSPNEGGIFAPSPLV